MEIDNIGSADTGGFISTIEQAIEWFKNTGTIMTDIYNCFPSELQTFFFMIFVLGFGFAFLFKIIDLLT